MNNSLPISEIIKRLIQQIEYIRSLDGTIIDTQQVNMFVPGSFLHQGTENITEEQSAQFEKDNKIAFDTARHIVYEIRKRIDA